MSTRRALDRVIDSAQKATKQGVRYERDKREEQAKEAAEKAAQEVNKEQSG